MKQKLTQTLTLVVLVSSALCASGAKRYWDNNGDTAGFGAAGGIWGADTNWSADANGTAVPNVVDTTVDDDLFLGTAITGLNAGTVTVDSTNQAFRSLTFGAASGAITIDGGALNLAAPASRIVANGASNTIASVLAGTNGLRKASSTLSHTDFLNETATLLFANANLADYANAGGVIWGGSIPRVPANAYFFVNDGSTATFQLQTIHDADTVCLKVEMTQAGADITGNAVYAKRVTGHQLGYDFDQEVNTTNLATSVSSPGYGVSQTLLLTSTRSHEPFLTKNSIVVLKDVPLSEISGVTASMAGDSVSDSPAPMSSYYFQNNGSLCTVQLQAYNGDYTKCVKIELTQSGADVAARVLYSKYLNQRESNRLGLDFDTDGTTMNTATSFSAGGYGICQLRFFASKLALTGTNTYSGGTTIEVGELEIAGAGLLGAGAYTGAIVNAGQLIFNSSASQTLAGNISGSGSLIKTSPEKEIGTLTYPNFLYEHATLVFPNASLADCTAAGGVLGGWAINRTAPNPEGSPLPAEAYHYTNDGTNASWQLQAIDGSHTKCVKVELTQKRSGIFARAVYAKYLLNEHNLGFDFDTGGEVMYNIATSYAEHDYGVAETSITILRHSPLILAGTNNTYTGGTSVNKGTLFVTGSANSLPSSGGIVVNDGGNLTLGTPNLPSDNWGGVGNGNQITVNSGGALTLAGGFNAGAGRLITLDGGLLNCVYTENNDSANYINNLVLMNGARVTGYKIRAAYSYSGTIKVAGTSPSSLEAGINVARLPAANHPLTLDVANVTGDAAVDFFIPGIIRDYSAYLSGTPIIKTGEGTVSLSAANTFTGMVTVTAGTVALDANSALNPDNNIVLNGGALDMRAFTNTVNTLSLSADSAIVIGDGQLAFADSGALDWAEGATLTLIGTLGPRSLRFGTNASALKATQLAAISCNGQSVWLRSDGYLSAAARGALILLR